MAFIYISPSTVDLKGYGQDYKVLGQLIASILTMTPQRSGLEPAPLLNILTGLLLAKLSIPSSLAKYLRTVLPCPITAENYKENQVRDNLNKHKTPSSNQLFFLLHEFKDINVIIRTCQPTSKAFHRENLRERINLLLHSGSAQSRWSDTLDCVKLKEANRSRTIGIFLNKFFILIHVSSSLLWLLAADTQQTRWSPAHAQ